MQPLPKRRSLDEILNGPVDFSLLDGHETRILELLLTLEGHIKGFPDTERKLFNTTRAWARFLSLAPHNPKFDPQVEPYMTAEEKAPYLKHRGAVPAIWLIEQVRDCCEWLPAPIRAREIYLSAGFAPQDGMTLDKLTGYQQAQGGRKGDE
jgi:hypothetical protein